MIGNVSDSSIGSRGSDALLVIDTCGEVGSVTLARQEPLATTTLSGRTASERLVATIRELVRGHGIRIDQLQAVAVVNGPGSFTGVRIGVSAAKGLCQAVGVPLIAISRLAVLARRADLGKGTDVQAVLDAGRNEFYVGVYRGGLRVREVLAARDEVISGAFAQGASRLSTAVCEPKVAEGLRELSPHLIVQPTAETALPIAYEKLANKDFADLATLDANYLRRTDAEIFAKHAEKKAVAPVAR